MRKITCTKCVAIKPTLPEDIAMGYSERRTYGTSMRSLNCDYCNKRLNVGDDVIALSSPANMLEWEEQYINVKRDSVLRESR